MEKQIILKMVDGGIRDFVADNYTTEGCPTCNYGAMKVLELEVVFSNSSKTINLETEFRGNKVTIGDLMKIILNKIEEIELLKEEDFLDWLIDEVLNLKSGEVEFYIHNN